MRSIIEFFANRTMGFKLIVVFLLVILIPMTLLAYMSYRVIDSRLMKDADERIGFGLKSAWTEYYVRGEQMRYGMLQAASMEEIKGAIKRRDSRYLKQMMTRWKQMRPYVDIWEVTDENGDVIARLNSDQTGDRLEFNGMVFAAIDNGEPKISTELLGKDLLRREGKVLSELNAVPDGNGPEKQTPASGESSVMALMVVTPVMDDGHRPLGSIITGDILNNDNYIPDTVAYRNQGLFTTVSVDGLRIASNVIDGNGENARWTRLDGEDLYRIKNAKFSKSEWSLSGMTYISIFEPIKDFKGRVIGSLDVGISKEKVWALQRENQWVIALITVVGLSVSLLVAFISTYRITRPLKALKEKLGAFAGGDMDARVEVSEDPDSKDEIRSLARTFNHMMDEVGRREEDKQRYLRETEERSREVIALNDELKKTNEELEVAYEETQSQTEELHAINEELKLLNEDLDRKNAELKKANLIITLEEEELKRAKNKLRLIYDSIRDYILLVDYDSRILEANRYFFEKFRMNEPDAVGKNAYSFFGMEVQARACPVRKAIDSMSPVEIEKTTPDGKVFTLHAFPLLGDEASRNAVVYIRDITEQRLLAHRLIQSDKLSSLGELVSGVAHELNNPLTGIMCFSELLMEHNIGDDVKSKIAKINDASLRCKKIIDNLLTFARWKRPEKRFEDVNKIVKQSLDLRGYQLRMDNIEVVLDLDESIPQTMLDENQIHQVFLNLINNARDAVLEKGRGGTIKISSRHSSGRIIVKFDDSGIGMSQHVANRIFDPFFTTKGVGRGTGLGLSISYGIVNEHGGNIYASSAPGIGTTFVVELPVVERADAEEEEKVNSGVAASERLKAMAKGRRALVVDDEAIVLDLLCYTLNDTGFLVDRSVSGEDALVKLKENSYDLIISDIKMPGLGGIGFYREVASIRPEAIKKIIFISGDSVNRETREFLSEAGNLSLKKPFTVDQLNKIVSRLITQETAAE
ncbi:MAG: response regulator [Deltaproteobacteria bacterium]|nr:response regulator [Deltaproteobacteria bacterium]